MLSPTDQKFLKEYKKQLKSKRKFILAHGMAFGILMLITQSVYRYVIKGELFAFENLLIEVIVWLGGGLFYGLIVYWFLHKKMRKIEAKERSV